MTTFLLMLTLICVIVLWLSSDAGAFIVGFFAMVCGMVAGVTIGFGHADSPKRLSEVMVYVYQGGTTMATNVFEGNVAYVVLRETKMATTAKDPVPVGISLVYSFKELPSVPAGEYVVYKDGKLVPWPVTNTDNLGGTPK